jgi:hypothetical protein
VEPVTAAAPPLVDLSDPRVFVRETAAREVTARIEALPFLHRAEYVKSAYVGRWVRWSGVVYSVQPSRRGFMVGLDEVRGKCGLSAWLHLPPDSRASVEPLRRGDVLDYEGMIEGASERDVDVVNVKIVRRPS